MLSVVFVSLPRCACGVRSDYLVSWPCHCGVFAGGDGTGSHVVCHIYKCVIGCVCWCQQHKWWHSGLSCCVSLQSVGPVDCHAVCPVCVVAECWHCGLSCCVSCLCHCRVHLLVVVRWTVMLCVMFVSLQNVGAVDCHALCHCRVLAHCVIGLSCCLSLQGVFAGGGDAMDCHAVCHVCVGTQCGGCHC